MDSVMYEGLTTGKSKGSSYQEVRSAAYRHRRYQMHVEAVLGLASARKLSRALRSGWKGLLLRMPRKSCDKHDGLISATKIVKCL